MDKSITMEKHLIEAWGLWWTQWQRQTKDKMKKHSISPQAFLNEHMGVEPKNPSVSSQNEGFPRKTTIVLVLPPR